MENETYGPDEMQGFELHSIHKGILEISLTEDKVLVEINDQGKHFMILAKEEIESLIELLQELLTCEHPSSN